MITILPLSLQPYAMRHGESAIALLRSVAIGNLVLTKALGDEPNAGEPA